MNLHNRITYLGSGDIYSRLIVKPIDTPGNGTTDPSVQLLTIILAICVTIGVAIGIRVSVTSGLRVCLGLDLMTGSHNTFISGQ